MNAALRRRKTLQPASRASESRRQSDKVTVSGNVCRCRRSGVVGTSFSLGEVIIRLGHVHVYRDGKLIVKWHLDNRRPMKGKADRRILSLIEKLEAEGLL